MRITDTYGTFTIIAFLIHNDAFLIDGFLFPDYAHAGQWFLAVSGTLDRERISLYTRDTDIVRFLLHAKGTLVSLGLLSSHTTF